MKTILGAGIVSLLVFATCCSNDSQQPLNNFWQRLNVPYFGQPSDIQFTSGNTGYILGYDTTLARIIVKTFDGGQTWQKIYFPLDTNAIIPNAQLNVSPFKSSILFSDYGMRSNDGGNHWVLIDSACLFSSGRYYFSTPANLVRAGEFIYTSSDSGFTWSKVYAPSSNGFALFSILKFTSNLTGYASGGIYFDATNYGQMAKTIDGGGTWKSVNYTFHNIRGMSFINDNVGYIVMQMDSGNQNETYHGGSSLYKTQDGGNTWHVIKKNIFTNYISDGRDLYFRNELDGFVLGAGGVYHTTDGGISWQNESPPSNTIANLCFPNSSCCYAVDWNGNVFKRTLQ